MNIHHNHNLTPFSKKLRSSMTKEERHLWYDFLKKLPMTVHRQKVIGPYIVDFYIAGANLVIELDGSQHYEQFGIFFDEKRDAYLKKQGFRVLRYSNRDIYQDFDGICADILNHLQKASP